MAKVDILYIPAVRLNKMDSLPLETDYPGRIIAHKPWVNGKPPVWSDLDKQDGRVVKTLDASEAQVVQIAKRALRYVGDRLDVVPAECLPPEPMPENEEAELRAKIELALQKQPLLLDVAVREILANIKAAPREVLP